MGLRLMTIAAAVGTMVACGSLARADSYPPFYGYSPYFGGPTTYFTPDDDVHSASTLSEGLPGFGTRTYYRGGPFYRYRPNVVRRAYYPRHQRQQRRRSVLVRKG